MVSLSLSARREVFLSEEKLQELLEYVEQPATCYQKYETVRDYMHATWLLPCAQEALQAQKKAENAFQGLLDKELTVQPKDPLKIQALDLAISPRSTQLQLELASNLNKMRSCLEFLQYPYSLCPKKLAYMTKRVALDLLQGRNNPFDHLKVLGFLGEGVTACVERVRVGDAMLARKTISGAASFDFLIQEYTTLLELEDPAVVKVAHIDSKSVYYEELGGQTLYEVELTLEQGLDIYMQLLEVIRRMHQAGKVHGDIHRDNVIVSVDKQHMTLIDFATCDTYDCVTAKEKDIQPFLNCALQFFKSLGSKAPLKLVESFERLKEGYEHESYDVNEMLFLESLQEFFSQALEDLPRKKTKG